MTDNINTIYNLPKGLVRICSGLLESEEQLTPSCRKAIYIAEHSVGENYSSSANAERKKLISAVKLSLINRKIWSYENLCRKYGLPISYNNFTNEKKKFCVSLINELNFSKDKY